MNKLFTLQQPPKPCNPNSPKCIPPALFIDQGVYILLLAGILYYVVKIRIIPFKTLKNILVICIALLGLWLTILMIFNPKPFEL